MPLVRRISARRRLQFLLGLVLLGLFLADYQFGDDHVPVLNAVAPVVLAKEVVSADPFENMIRTDPLAALIEARTNHVRKVKDYQVTFVKQEALPSGMSAEQEIQVKFRNEPYSVFMHWTRNQGLAERVLYVKGRWLDHDAEDEDLREQAVCQPGVALRLLVKSIKQPIHGSLSHDASRRYIDEFGFRRSLDLLIKYCEIANKKNELKLEYRGESFFDGRQTWVVRRHLPYEKEGGTYPDRVCEIHIDREYRIPVAVYCYSKDDMKPESLLGKYEYTNIRLNAGLSEADFDPATYGM